MKNHQLRVSCNMAGAIIAFGLVSACGKEADTRDAGAAQAPLALLSTDAKLAWGPCPPIFPAGCEISVLHGEPSKPNADIFLRVPAGYTLPAHSHTSVERMVLVTGQLDVQYKGSQVAHLAEGQYAYGPAGLPHRGECISAEPCTLFIAFEGAVDGAPFEGGFE